jgi:hypothetical protein
MANQLSGQTGASPREYNAHQRHSKQSRRRHDDQEIAFLAAQATRLSTTSAIIFAKLSKYSAATIKAAANLAAIP